MELNVEFLESGQGSRVVTPTHVCGATNNTCLERGCDTTTTAQSETFCQTKIEDETCDPTEGCMTTDCPTDQCVDSNSRAELCCPITEQNGCFDTVDNCVSYDCQISKHVCLVTNDIHDKECWGTGEDFSADCFDPNPTVPAQTVLC